MMCVDHELYLFAEANYIPTSILSKKHPKTKSLHQSSQIYFMQKLALNQKLLIVKEHEHSLK